jgi:hypothetical protein
MGKRILWRVRPGSVFTNAPDFRLWVCSDPSSVPPFSLRWQVIAGRATLLLPRGGGTDAAPASSSATRVQMSLEDLNLTRFVVVSDHSGARHMFRVGPIELPALQALQPSTWTALQLDGASALILNHPGPVLPAPAPAAPEAARIAALEAALEQSQQRVVALTRRVAELEGEIDAAGDGSAG